MTDLIIDKENLKNGFEFYSIENEFFSQRCASALRRLTPEVRSGIDKLAKKLYDPARMPELWGENLVDYLGAGYDPDIMLLILVCGYKIHDENMRRLDFDAEQRKIHLLRTNKSITADIETRCLPQIRYSSFLWGAMFQNILLLEVGILQYGIKRDANGNPFIAVHIPANVKLDSAAICASRASVEAAVEKYYGVTGVKYVCDSWMLSNQVYSLLDKNSNIAAFHDIFEVEDGPDCFSALLSFVYSVYSPSGITVEDLPERTSLQRKLKEYLLAGGVVLEGKGTLKWE